MACDLCDGPGGVVLWRDERLRVVRVADPDYPAFLRVVWNAHVKEMTDLSADESEYFMRAVFATEGVLRNLLNPEKMNLASLGNQTPHLHWHVIPRFRDDRHFPNPVWAPAAREGDTQREIQSRTVADETLQRELAGKLGSALR